MAQQKKKYQSILFKWLCCFFIYLWIMKLPCNSLVWVQFLRIWIKSKFTSQGSQSNKSVWTLTPEICQVTDWIDKKSNINLYILSNCIASSLTNFLLSGLVQTCLNWSGLVSTCLNLFKFVQTCSKSLVTWIWKFALWTVFVRKE